MKTELMRSRERAVEVKERHAAAVAAVRADADLNEEGRSRKIAALHAACKAKLDELKQQEQQTLSARRVDLEKELFSSRPTLGQDRGSFAISMRDAADRAAQLNSPDEARNLMARALRQGDDVLARAVMQFAIEHNDSGREHLDSAWNDVAQAYLDTSPHLSRVVEELAEIETLGTRQAFSPFSMPAPHGVAPQYLNEAHSQVVRERAQDAAAVSA